MTALRAAALFCGIVVTVITWRVGRELDSMALLVFGACCWAAVVVMVLCQTNEEE